MDQIVIRGARTHNLKDINLTIPRDKLVVITGLSGSGKSSLAFDTLYGDSFLTFLARTTNGAQPFVRKHFREVAAKSPENKQKSQRNH